MKYKTRLKSFLAAFWFAVVGFCLPFILALVLTCLTLNTKGIGADLGSEKDLVIFMGIIFLFILSVIISTIIYLTLNYTKNINRDIVIAGTLKNVNVFQLYGPDSQTAVF